MTFGMLSQEEADLHDKTKAALLNRLLGAVEGGEHPNTVLVLSEAYAVLLKGEPSGAINAPKAR